jgi:signal transduction histidine kinase
MVAVVAVGTLGGHPRPAWHGDGLGVALAFAVFAISVAVAIRDRFVQRGIGLQAAVIAAMGAAGVALAAVQPRGAAGLAVGAAVWMAVTRLPLARALAILLACAMTVSLDVAFVLAGNSSSTVLASTLLCALIGLIAYFLKQAREGQDRAEVLLAQLEDAREEQTRAAAITERARIASELHDVLAHALSGAAIQLQGARKLAEREHAQPQTRDAIDRASELVREGLSSARQAVGALRGEDLPSVAQLQTLVRSCKSDMNVDATLAIEGRARELPADVSLALYRGAQEALTNVARYAPGASITVVLSYAPDHTMLSVEDHVPFTDPPVGGGLADVGGGRGLAGMRERLERVGGSMHAGPTDAGWRVELQVPR